MAGLQQQAASGQIPPLTVAKIIQLVESDRMELAEAMNKVTQEAMEEQKKKEQLRQALQTGRAFALQ